jgi:hypothetical protein
VQDEGVQFVASDDDDHDEGPPLADNVQGHLLGLLEAHGADPQDECAERASDVYGDSAAGADAATTAVPSQAHMDEQMLRKVLDMLRARGGRFENGALVFLLTNHSKCWRPRSKLLAVELKLKPKPRAKCKMNL